MLAGILLPEKAAPPLNGFLITFESALKSPVSIAGVTATLL